MNSEYLAETWWWVALWAKYRDNGWSQAGDRGTNTGSDPWVGRPQKTDSQASISASSSGYIGGGQICSFISSFFAAA